MAGERANWNGDNWPQWGGAPQAAWTNSLRHLGGVDKFEPISGGGEMDHSEEAVGKLIVAGGDGAVDLEVTEHALDAIALPVERAVMLDLHAAV